MGSVRAEGTHTAAQSWPVLERWSHGRGSSPSLCLWSGSPLSITNSEGRGQTATRITWEQVALGGSAVFVFKL